MIVFYCFLVCLLLGWGGFGGIDACVCGISGICEGSVGVKCNCDFEDG